MIGLLLAGSCLGVFRMLAKWKTMKQAFPAVVAILLVLFGLLTAIMVYVALLMGTGPVLLALLLLALLAAVGAVVVYLVENFRELNYGMLALFVVYLLAVVYITLLSRDTTGDHTISLFRMDMLANALRTHSLVPMKHIFLNMALFMPFGFFASAHRPGRAGRHHLPAAVQPAADDFDRDHPDDAESGPGRPD